MSKMEKISWDQITDSSNVSDLYYHEPDKTICVKFKGGGLYSYMGADQEMFMSLRHAHSVGKYLNNVIKALPYTRWGSEDDLLAHLNISHKYESTCIRCDLDFMTHVEGRRVCDDCWADDPT